MSTPFTTPVGRLVQGGMTLQQKKDMKGQPVRDDNGNPVNECFMAIAFAKNDPNFPALYALLVAQARASFPHLFDAAGECTHPRFAWKLQNGDGVDDTGQSVANKPGFAGHWILKMATRYAPRCYPYGKYSPADIFAEPDKVIKKGYYVRVGGTIDGNGVQPDNRQAVPGLFVSPTLVELVAYGEEIVSGPDPTQVFGQAPAITSLPAGASTTPVVAPAGSGLAPPPLPGQQTPAQAAPQGLPPIGGVAPAALPQQAPAGLPPIGGVAPAALPQQAPAGLPPLQQQAPAQAAPAGLPPLPGANVAPPVAAAPQYQMTAAAQGATREALNAQGYTDDVLIQHGYMVRTA